MKQQEDIYFGIGRFWPKGVNVYGVYVDHGRPSGISYEGLVKARNDQLGKISARGMVALLAIAADLANRPVSIEEILVEAKK
jgi:hypothetical protein